MTLVCDLCLETHRNILDIIKVNQHTTIWVVWFSPDTHTNVTNFTISTADTGRKIVGEFTDLWFFQCSIFQIIILFNSSILNKLTPEKFDKLSLELLNVGITNQIILKGIILLVSALNLMFSSYVDKLLAN